jgi:hypothetical protein
VIEHEHITCAELVELVTDYLEGALLPPDREKFEHHAGLCAGCLNYLNQMRHTIRAVGRLTEDTIPVPIKHELLLAFRDWKRN